MANADPLFGTAQSRILKTDTREHSKYLALIVNKSSKNDAEHHLCTGTLISRRQVLTSASCIAKVSNINQLEIIFGTTSLDSTRHHTFEVLSKLTYGDWCKDIRDCFYDERTDDICILRIKSIAYGIPYAKIAGISSNLEKSYPLPGVQIELFGWGHTKSEFRPSFPSKGYLEVIAKLDCEARVKQLVPSCLSDIELPEKVFCAVANPPIHAVEGDFGGPAFYNDGKTIVAIAIQRCPIYHPHDVNDGQVNLLLQLSYYRDFFTTVLDHF
ncbi:hypothetical protein QAD02_011396 [Eretmocerus hayati]|uniref:Uncharacterized protein n=1 Tax=Eretmocerus hayati TaxID=131215 RepID=A0ACC2NWC6_9HYME|nr:hypothetical protein QAD02_011396 [Eretmocerus hayati]